MLTGIFALISGALQQVYLLLSYISNLNSFPKPLTAEEEKDYIDRYKNGDMEARDVLIEHNLRLVAHVAKKYISIGRDIDDLISIGTIGLIKGINSFNDSKNTKLATYVGRCIENEILMVIRARKKSNNEISIEEPIGMDKEGNQITFNDILSNEHDEVLDEVSRKMQVKALFESIQTVLGKREMNVLKMRYGLMGYNTMTQKEVAKSLGISRSYVSRIEKKAIKKLKKTLYT